jgi:5-methylcytosine-specific restriction endonuclease McrA
VVAHKGSEALFFDPINLQSLCSNCHNSAKQQMENGKTVVAFDVSGWPI